MRAKAGTRGFNSSKLHHFIVIHKKNKKYIAKNLHKSQQMPIFALAMRKSAHTNTERWVSG